MQKEATLSGLFSKATLSNDFDAFIIIIDHLKSVFPLLPAPRKNDADALAEKCTPPKFDTYQIFLGCYYAWQLGTKPRANPANYFYESRRNDLSNLYRLLGHFENGAFEEITEKGVKAFGDTLSKHGNLGKAMGRFILGRYYQLIEKNYDEAIKIFKKCEYAESLFVIGEIYFNLANAGSKKALEYRQLANEHLYAYLNSANITQPAVFTLLGTLCEREQDFVTAAKFYCLGKTCGFGPADTAYQNLLANDAALIIARQTWGACQTVLEKKRGEIVTLEEFCIGLDEELITLTAFREYYDRRGGIFTPAAAAAASPDAPPTPPAEKSEKCLLM